MHQNTACYVIGLAPFKNHSTSAHLTLLWNVHHWHLHGFQMWAAFSWVVLGICPLCSSAFVVAWHSPSPLPSWEPSSIGIGQDFLLPFNPFRALRVWGSRFLLSACPHASESPGDRAGSPFTPLHWVCTPSWHCRHGLSLQENRLTLYPGHDLPSGQGTALCSNTHRQFVHCLSPSPYGLIPLKAPY